MPDGLGNAEQVRLIAEQVAEAAVIQVERRHPELREATIPAPLKWAAGIIAALFTMGIGAMGVWLVTTVSEMQVTLARMDERMSLTAGSQDGRFGEFERRVTKLESYHANGGKE